MKTRARALFAKWYERFLLFLGRHAPKTHAHINDKPFVVAAAPRAANFCLYCLWTYMQWDDESEMWTCPKCGLSCHPPLAVTEKRPALLLPARVERHTDQFTKAGEYARAVREGKIKLGAWVQDRPVWTQDNMELNTGELPHITPPYNRRTG